MLSYKKNTYQTKLFEDSDFEAQIGRLVYVPNLKAVFLIKWVGQKVV